MTRVKLLVTSMVAVGVLAMAASTFAQRAPGGPGGGPGGPGGGRGGFGGGQRRDPVGPMADELGLSQTQQTKIRAIYEAARGQFEGAMGDRTKMEALRKGIDSQIMAVLTPAQKSKLASMGGLEGLQITGRYRHELDQLGLSADQKHKTNVILNEMVSKVKAMRATMGPGGPGGGGPRGAGGPGGQRAGGGGGMRQVMEGYRAQIEAVLSASQKAKFEADMPAGGRGGRGGPGGGGGRGGGQGGGAR